MMLNRRALLTGIIAAPLVAKATNLMPIRIPIIPTHPEPWLPCDGRELLTRQYSKLAQALGDVITTTIRTPTFRLPDLRPMIYADPMMDVQYRYEINTGEGHSGGLEQYMPVGSLMFVKRSAIEVIEHFNLQLIPTNIQP